MNKKELKELKCLLNGFSALELSKSDTKRVDDFLKIVKREQLTLKDVGACQFEEYARFCIECDRKGMKPLKHADFLNIGQHQRTADKD